jgi:hypothetical protein
MKRDDDQQLWELLGRARPVQVSPFFARNVLRKLREGGGRLESLRRLLRPRALIPATGLAVAIIAAILTMHRPASVNSGEKIPDVIVSIDPQDYDVVADLDELITTDDDNPWDDDTQTL